MSRIPRWCLLWAAGVLAASLLFADSAQAGWRRGCGAGCWSDCGPGFDSCDVMATCAAPAVHETGRWVTDHIEVPHTTYRTELRPVVRYRPEMQRKVVQVQRLVPDVRQVAKRCIVMKPVQRMRVEHFVTATPQWQNVSYKVPVTVPERVVRNGVRVVCEPVRVQVNKTVYRDAGHFETRCFVDCCGCSRSCQIWVPNMVAEQVPTTVCQMRIRQIPYQYEDTVCRTTFKVVTERVCRPVYTRQSREVPCIEMVPTTVERMVNETFCRTVVENQEVEYCAMVPYQDQVEVAVPVVTMVRQEVRRWVCESGKGVADHGTPPADAPAAPLAK